MVSTVAHQDTDHDVTVPCPHCGKQRIYRVAVRPRFHGTSRRPTLISKPCRCRFKPGERDGLQLTAANIVRVQLGLTPYTK